jgi:hypothetical protein
MVWRAPRHPRLTTTTDNNSMQTTTTEAIESLIGHPRRLDSAEWAPAGCSE